jgi:hypothetical protein
MIWWWKIIESDTNNFTGIIDKSFAEVKQAEKTHTNRIDPEDVLCKRRTMNE